MSMHKNIWKQYLPEYRIIKGNYKDNFWMMAEDGPCGGCTEIHYDLSQIERNVPELVNQDDPTLIEIWNIVFVQYNYILEKCYEKKNVKNSSYKKLERFYVNTLEWKWKDYAWFCKINKRCIKQMYFII
jgi:alanyl-tRNA synthetase